MNQEIPGSGINMRTLAMSTARALQIGGELVRLCARAVDIMEVRNCLRIFDSLRDSYSKTDCFSISTFPVFTIARVPPYIYQIKRYMNSVILPVEA